VKNAAASPDRPKRFPTLDVANPAPSITVRYPGTLRTYTRGVSKLQVSAADVRGALDRLERDHPELYRNICDETGKVRQHLNVFVNTENVRELSGLDTKLAPGDELTILPAVSGG
jgi:MoaD family protein